VWAGLAAENKGEGDIDDATELQYKINQKATRKERASASSLMENWRTAPCEWAEVFPDSKNAKK
jgi:hypothetical protein